MDFVRGGRCKIDGVLMQRRRYLACCLHNIHVHVSSGFRRSSGERTHRLQHSRLVVCPGKAHGITAGNSRLPLRQVSNAIGKHGCSLAASSAQCCRVLRGQCQHARKASQGSICCLGSSCREDDFICMHAEECSHFLAGFIQGTTYCLCCTIRS